MGLSSAIDVSQEMDLVQGLTWHLQSNHFPPIPVSMVQPCIDAIDAFYEGDTNKLISLPEGIGYKGLTAAPAWAIIEQHHLDPWLDTEEE